MRMQMQTCTTVNHRGDQSPIEAYGNKTVVAIQCRIKTPSVEGEQGGKGRGAKTHGTASRKILADSRVPKQDLTPTRPNLDANQTKPRRQPDQNLNTASLVTDFVFPGKQGRRHLRK